MPKRDAPDRVVNSSGNVFADLDLPHSEKDMLKIHIAQAICHTINRRKLTQNQAAEITGLDQARISNIVRGRLATMSVERLFQCLLSLGRDVDIRFARIREQGRGKLIAKNAA